MGSVAVFSPYYCGFWTRTRGKKGGGKGGGKKEREVFSGKNFSFFGKGLGKEKKKKKGGKKEGGREEKQAD